MKPSILINAFVFLPITWLVTYVALVLIGLVSFVLGAGDQFYCSIYCKLGLPLFSLTTIAFLVHFVYRYTKAPK